VTYTSEQQEVIQKLGQEYGVLSEKSQIGSVDQVRNVLVAHAAFNGRKAVMQDDIVFAEYIRRYLADPFAPNNNKIIGYYGMGLSYAEICKKLGMDSQKYKPFISRIIKQARQRGIVD
jgi:hypothetical protein